MTDTQRPELPLYIDSQILGSFKSCPRKFAYRFLNYLAPSSISIHLHAGGCIATGLEAMRKALWVDKVQYEEAWRRGFKAFTLAWGNMPDPITGNKSFIRCACTLDAYFKHFGIDTDPLKPMYIGENPAVEVGFSVPLPVSHPSGQPFIWCGRMDWIALYNGQPYGVDEKTTQSLGQSWLKQWDLRNQFLGYTWGLRMQNIPLVGMIARGIGILKTDITFAESINTYNSRLLDTWLGQTCRDLERMVSLWHEGYWDYDFNESCNAYGGCEFKPLCTSQNPHQWIGNYSTQRWDPLAKDPTHSLEAYRAYVEAHK